MNIYYAIGGGVLILIILVVILAFKYDKQLLINLAFKACTDAESYFGNGKGEAKLNCAIEQIKGSLPSFAKVFFNETAIKMVIETIALPVLQKIFGKLKENLPKEPQDINVDPKVQEARDIVKSISEIAKKSTKAKKKTTK